MGNPWTVKPESERYDAVWIDQDGKERPFWIRLKRRLSNGEDRHVKTAGWKSVSNLGSPEATVNIDWRAQSLARTEQYLVDWSLTDDSDKKLDLTADVIEALDPDLSALIEEKITGHVEAMAARKKPKPTDGEQPPSTT